jgi:hypothetical protein
VSRSESSDADEIEVGHIAWGEGFARHELVGWAEEEDVGGAKVGDELEEVVGEFHLLSIVAAVRADAPGTGVVLGALRWKIVDIAASRAIMCR